MNSRRRKAATKPAPPTHRRSTASCRRTCRARRRSTTRSDRRDHHDAAGQPCGCTDCGGRLRQIGEDVSEQLEYVPARFKVIRHVRPKLACVDVRGIVQAAAPSRPIARGLAGPGLLAHVMVSKYATTCRCTGRAASTRAKASSIDRSTMADWVDQGDDAARPAGRRARALRAGRRRSCTPTTRRCRC